MTIISREMGSKWGTSETDGPYANRFGTMSDDEREELGSGIVGAWNILADDRCTHHVFWTPSTSKLHIDEEELTTQEDWDTWLEQVYERFSSIALQEPKDYKRLAKELIDWARVEVDRTTGFAQNTESVQEWLDATDAVLSWTEITDRIIRFKYEPSSKPGASPDGVQFDAHGELAKIAEEE
jgi:hypothetical protein